MSLDLASVVLGLKVYHRPGSRLSEVCLVDPHLVSVLARFRDT